MMKIEEALLMSHFGLSSCQRMHFLNLSGFTRSSKSSLCAPLKLGGARLEAGEGLEEVCGISTHSSAIVQALCKERKTLGAGKLTDQVLKLFMATGNIEILSLTQALNIQQIITPVLPTRCSEKL
ncbi:hypothetical protein GIB67_001901 [Kingdonia uniflora]|uniref:Uncharacterized protein n=1 Tax=Kingdonia uniflora TaxID=39325 RepID=A0A7J7LEN1_9MAGN|nr:hypothetical protein GIB67_001901 [Kingdonia uniflora]